MIKINRRQEKEKYIDNILYRLCACGCKEYFEVKDNYPQQKFFNSGHSRKGKHNSEESINKQLATQGRKRRISIPCLCGCGEMTKLGSKYLPGHYMKSIAKPKSPPKLCQCGCGEYAKPGNKYILGHNKGHNTPHTEETKQIIREKRALQIFSKETLEKRAVAMVKKWAEPGYKEKLYNIKIGKPIKCSEWAKNNLGRYIRTDEWKKNQADKWRGDKCNFWQGGISFEDYPQEFNKQLKEQIRERDGYICQVCFVPQDELNDKYKHKLNVHHIDYNKKNCNPDNLISLCDNCHAKTNTNREQWQFVFASQ